MLNLDTHILIYLLSGALNPREQQLITQHPLAISDIVLWELAKLVQLGRISLELAHVSTQLDFRSDPADELIAAASIVEGVPLLTRDQKILVSRLVPFA